MKRKALPSTFLYIIYCSLAVNNPHNPSKKLNGVTNAETTLSFHLDMLKELELIILDLQQKANKFPKTYATSLK